MAWDFSDCGEEFEWQHQLTTHWDESDCSCLCHQCLLDTGDDASEMLCCDAYVCRDCMKEGYNIHPNSYFCVICGDGEKGNL